MYFTFDLYCLYELYLTDELFTIFHCFKNKYGIDLSKKDGAL